MLRLLIYVDIWTWVKYKALFTKGIRQLNTANMETLGFVLNEG